MTSRTQTVVIWDTCEAEIKFFIINEDLTRFDNIYINRAYDSEQENNLANELYEQFYNDEGYLRSDLVDKFPVEAVKCGASVITCGFIP